MHKCTYVVSQYLAMYENSTCSHERNQYNADGEILKGWKPEHLKIILIQFRSNNKLSSSLPTLNNLTMVFTCALATAFFCATNHMGLVNNFRVALDNKGIVSVNDLADFCKKNWHQVVTNLKYPASLPDPDNDGQFVWAPMITLGAKSLERLRVASEAARYY